MPRMRICGRACGDCGVDADERSVSSRLLLADARAQHPRTWRGPCASSTRCATARVTWSPRTLSGVTIPSCAFPTVDGAMIAAQGARPDNRARLLVETGHDLPFARNATGPTTTRDVCPIRLTCRCPADPRGDSGEEHRQAPSRSGLRSDPTVRIEKVPEICDPRAAHHALSGTLTTGQTHRGGRRPLPPESPAGGLGESAPGLRAGSPRRPSSPFRTPSVDPTRAYCLHD